MLRKPHASLTSHTVETLRVHAQANTDTKTTAENAKKKKREQHTIAQRENGFLHAKLVEQATNKHAHYTIACTVAKCSNVAVVSQADLGGTNRGGWISSNGTRAGPAQSSAEIHTALLRNERIGVCFERVRFR